MCQLIVQFLVKKMNECGAKGKTGTGEKIRSHLGVILWTPPLLLLCVGQYPVTTHYKIV